MILFIDLDLFLSENEDLNRNEIWKFNITITYEHRCWNTKNRLLKFCYVPTTSAACNRLLFFLFLLCPFTVLKKQTSLAVCAIKQSTFLDVYAHEAPFINFFNKQSRKIVFCIFFPVWKKSNGNNFKVKGWKL